MRDAIWEKVRSAIPQGQILPLWALAVHAVLYPINFFYWRVSATRGYQWQSDSWRIHGARFDDKDFYRLAKLRSPVHCLVTVEDGTVQFTVVKDSRLTERLCQVPQNAQINQPGVSA